MENIEQIMKEEGDFFEWTYTAKNGLEVDCFIERNRLLALCGYVGLTHEYEQVVALQVNVIRAVVGYTQEYEQVLAFH